MEQARRRTMTGERFLSFMLGGEEYCIGINRVREIMAMTTITPLPQTPDFIKGVINLRGRIIPIIDLRLKLGMEAKVYTDRTCIIVLDLSEAGEQTYVGVVVDAIQEVVGIPAEKISQVAYVNARVKAEYIRGIAESEKGVRILLDASRVLSEEEIGLVEGIQKTNSGAVA
jgi:purine-binding chemotaxis protein CheW